MPGAADAIMEQMKAIRSTGILAGIQSTRNELIFVIAVTVAASILRFYRIGEKSIWLDEAFSVWIARHSLWEGWRWLIRIDQHPPLYYSLLHLWIQLFGELQGAVRILSALFSTATVPIFYAAARQLLDRPAAAIAVGILAASPFHVQFAQETRMYALLTFEVACVLYFLVRLLTKRDQPARDWVGLSVSQALVMLTHNTAAVFLPVALNAAMAIIYLLFPSEHEQRKGDSMDGATLAEEGEVAARAGPSSESVADPDAFWSRWIRYQGLAILLWLPWAMPFIIQTVGVERGFWLPPPWPKLVLDTFRNFHFAFFPAEFPMRPLWMWGYPVLAFAGLVGVIFKGISRLDRSLAQPRSLAEEKHKRKDGSALTSWAGGGGTAILLVCLFALPHIIALVVSMRRPIYAERPLIWTTLPYFLLIAWGIRWLGGSALARLPAAARGGAGRVVAFLPIVRQGAQLLILLAILTLSGLSLNGYYFWFPKEAWDEAASYIAEQVEPGDVIVFNATWVQVPFEYYFKRYGLDTELKGLPVNLFERGELEPTTAESDVLRIQQLIEGREQVWLVYSHNWYSDPSGIVPRELGKLLRERERANFVGIQVIRFDSRE